MVKSLQFRSVALFTFLNIIVPAFPQESAGAKYPLITIPEVSSCKSDTFSIKAHVVDIYRCPPCPKGAECKPCMGDHVVVVDAAVPAKEQLFIFTEHPEEFTKESNYIFVVRLQNKVHPEFGVQLVSYKKAR